VFDRAATSMLAAAAACAAAAMAIFAGGFALYALVEPEVGSAGAAAIVAGASALIVGLYAWITILRARAKEREAALQQSALLDSLPLGLGGLAREHPIATLLVSVLGGAVAARHPKMVRDLLAIVARFGGDRG
jgi:hypothetical protein